MHEHALMQDLMRKIESVAREQNAARVVRVKVWLGALSHMTGPHFLEHFEDSSRGTCAEGAEVAFEISDDITHPNARGVLLQQVEVAGT